MLLALSHAELGGMYPVAGGSARFPRYAFGNLIGFTSGWIAFLGAVPVGPIMVEDMLLYTSNYISSLTTVSGVRPVLPVQGYLVAARLRLPFARRRGTTAAMARYSGLQVAFILALDPSELSTRCGAVSVSGGFGSSAALATPLRLGWLAVLLYRDASVSPGGTGLIYTGAS